MNTNISLSACAQKARLALEPKYGPGEARALVRTMFEELNGYTPVDLVVRGDVPVTDWLQRKVDDTVRRLLDNEPIQYIFGTARFHGLKLKVTPDVLIPRPETEEMVDLIADSAGKRTDLHVLDVCTGSGCIALALARTLPFSHIDAIDLSEKALAVARKNNEMLRCSVNFIRDDALKLKPSTEPLYDIIVSNPPYIAESERSSMHNNVLDHEPAMALFVPDDDPLRFYRAITRYAVGALLPGGELWFEINPHYAAEMKDMMAAEGLNDVQIIADMQKLQRFATGRK